MRPLTITRDIQIALAVWTAEVGRARREYHAEPFAGTRALNDNDKARDRMAASRAEKKRTT